jgi:hypothetical protein
MPDTNPRLSEFLAAFRAMEAKLELFADRMTGLQFRATELSEDALRRSLDPRIHPGPRGTNPTAPAALLTTIAATAARAGSWSHNLMTGAAEVRAFRVTAERAQDHQLTEAIAKAAQVERLTLERIPSVSHLREQLNLTAALFMRSSA